MGIVGCNIENIVGWIIENILENVVGCNIENGKLVGQTKERTWDWTTNKQIEKYCPFTNHNFERLQSKEMSMKLIVCPKQLLIFQENISQIH